MFKIYNLIIYSGIVAFVFLCATFFVGIFGLYHELHELFAWGALLFGCVHVGLVIFRYLKRKHHE